MKTTFENHTFVVNSSVGRIVDGNTFDSQTALNMVFIVLSAHIFPSLLLQLEAGDTAFSVHQPKDVPEAFRRGSHSSSSQVSA